MRIKDMVASLQLLQKRSQKQELWTTWGQQVKEKACDRSFVPLSEYPRPQFVRDHYEILNGWWSYRFAGQEEWNCGAREYSPEELDGEILVPFSPESSLSGVKRCLLPEETLWYQRKVDVHPRASQRLLLHFGAVDQECRIFWNGQEVGRHLGGYLPFSMDVTEALTQGENLLQVCCRDSSDRSWHSRGKQMLKPGGMFYTAQSGIWQTVWLEWVPETYIYRWRILPRYDEKELLVQLYPKGRIPAEELKAQVSVLEGQQVIARSLGKARGNMISFKIKVPDCKAWTPQEPFLYGLEFQMGEDRAESYFAMRAFTVEKDEQGTTRFMLNHKPFFLNGVLDQGYWPEGLYTAPCEEALAADIKNMKAAGFSLMRKHCKIEPLRWYYHCDRLGMLVWQDMVNGGETYDLKKICWLPTLFPRKKGKKGWALKTSGRLKKEGRLEWLRECRETVSHLFNVPSLAGWVIFNEGWGQFSTEAVTAMVKKLDSSRPVDSASGWFDFETGDFCSEHNYFHELVNPADKRGRATVISEYGGLVLQVPEHVYSSRIYGYHTIKNVQEFREKFQRLQDRLRVLEQEGLSGAIYTQVSDIEEEINGIYTYDRKLCKLEESERT